ncbi:thiolase C-terminal domain-containing protein [Halopiger thermotolerans]
MANESHLSRAERVGNPPASIAGVGMTAFVNADDRSLLQLLATAADRAMSDAAIEQEDVDTLHIGNMAAEAFNDRSGLGNALAGRLGLSVRSATRIENTSASGASAFRDAIDAIRAGRSETALVVGGELMSATDTATSTEIIGRIVHDAEYDQGVTLPSFAGLAARRYLDVTDATRETLARIAVKNHSNAARNPYAQFDDDVSIGDVLDSTAVAEPLRLFDCCPTSDGAAAVVLTADDDRVRVAACTSSVGTHPVADRPDPLAIESVREAGETAFERAGCDPEDVDVACIHDAFTILEWLEMEELGFAERGQAWQLTVEGETDVDGTIPVNPGGGLKARGHPLGASGIAQIVELVWQLRGDAPTTDGPDGDRVVDGAERGLAINVAGFGNHSVCTVLEGETA